MPNNEDTFLFGLAICVIFLIVGLYGIGYHVGYDKAKHKYCTHGESSITATLGKGGKIHESKPVRTGC